MFRHISIQPDITGFLNPIAGENLILKSIFQDILYNTESQVVISLRIGEYRTSDG